MNIGEKHYHDPAYQQQLARLHIAILGFYKGWEPVKGYSYRTALRDIQARNPDLILGQYTVLNEARDVPNDTAMADVVAKLGWSGWWLRNADGKRVQWTKQYSAWEINFTHWAKPDANGDRYPQWSTRRNSAAYFRDTPEMRIWYTDNVMYRPRVRADWDGDGIDDDPNDPRILTAWRQGYRDWWASIRALHPDIWIIGNVDSDLSEPEFSGQLDGAFLEGLMGKSWSLETRQGWTAMMQRYWDVYKHLRGPRIVGFNVWGDPTDYRFFRYAFASCLMGDGYFSFTDEKRGYSSVPWFDEYDVELGRAITPPPSQPWRDGVWRRDFERGVVLVNPGPWPRTVDLEPGLRHFAGRQAPHHNTGQPIARLTLQGKDGVVLVREHQQ